MVFPPAASLSQPALCLCLTRLVSSPGHVDAVRSTWFHAVCGRDVEASELLEGCVVLDTPLHRDAVVDVGGGVGPFPVALFEVSLCLEQHGVGDAAVTSSALGAGVRRPPTCLQRLAEWLATVLDGLCAVLCLCICL